MSAIMTALDDAWQDGDRAEEYGSLDAAGQALRDDARIAFDVYGLNAVWQVAVADVDELRELLTWVDDPLIWGTA